MANLVLPADKAGQHRIEGLVLSVMDYRENDGIIKLAAPDRICTVFARGIQKETSKNRRLAMPASRVILNYDPQYSSSMLYLINGSVEKSYWQVSQSLEMQSVNALLSALIQRYEMTPEIYSDLEAFWKAVCEKQENRAMLYACRLAILILKQAGTVMDVDECAVCGIQKNIAGISMNSGGFVCLDDFDGETGDLKWDKARLRQLRWLVHASRPNLEKLESFRWDLDFFIFLMDWYVFTTDMPLQALSFLKSLARP